MCKNDIRYQFNVYTSKKTVFVCFAIFKYQLQFCLSSVMSMWKNSVSWLVFLPPFVSFLSKETACNREAGGQS